jgi:hypothetical protein
MRYLAVLCAAAALAYATQATAYDGTPTTTIDPACGHMQMQADGTLAAPPGIDQATLASARDAILLFPIDALFDRLAAQLRDRIERERNDSPDDARRALITQLQADLPALLPVFKQDVVDTIATAIACHQTKDDLDTLAAFMRTPGGHKVAEAAINHAAGMPPLSAEESADVRGFASSDAGRHIKGEFADGSQTDVWVKAEIPLVSGLIKDWLQTKYHVSSLGGAL